MTAMSDSRPDWERKVKREHVVTFIPLGAKDQSDLVGKIADGLGVLGYEVPGSHPISIGWQRLDVPYPRIEITHGDDRIGLDSWERAVVYALAHADAFGRVEARTRTTVLPDSLAPQG